MCRQYVATGVEILRVFYGVTLYTDVKTSEAEYDDFLVIQQVVTHHFAQLSKHENDIGGVGGTVKGDFLRKLLESHNPVLCERA